MSHAGGMCVSRGTCHTGCWSGSGRVSVLRRLSSTNKGERGEGGCVCGHSISGGPAREGRGPGVNSFHCLPSRCLPRVASCLALPLEGCSGRGLGQSHSGLEMKPGPWHSQRCVACQLGTLHFPNVKLVVCSMLQTIAFSKVL